jgi:phospholipid transport system substrate-binding protein
MERSVNANGSMQRFTLLALTLIALVATLVPTCAQTSDPVACVNGFYRTLLETMKQAQLLGPKGRYDRLAPIIPKTFDIASMMRFAAGETWEKASARQKRAEFQSVMRLGGPDALVAALKERTNKLLGGM